MFRTLPASFRARNVLAGLAATVLCSLAATPAQATVVGVNPDITWGIPQSEVGHEVSLIKAAGVTWVRASIDLSGAEYAGPGQLNTSYLNSIDYAISTARSAGLNVLLELDRTPYWTSADPHKYTDSSGMHWNHYWKYANPQDYANIVSDVVNHYKGMGVHAYEVWNEPNNPSFWPSGVNAADYTELLKAAYPAIKAADPSATVAMAGLMTGGSYEFLQGMYDAGARGSYDVANFHIYPGGDPTQCARDSSGRPSVNSFCLLEGLRSEMAANGDSSPVWVTELGWSTCSQSYCVTAQQQASYVVSAYQLLNNAKYSYVQNTFLYQMRDLYWETSNSSWESSLGLFNRDWTPKPAYAALQAVGTGAVTGSTSGSGSGSGSGTGSVPVPVSGVVEQTAGSPVIMAHKHERKSSTTAVSASVLHYMSVSLNVKKAHRRLRARSIWTVGRVSGLARGHVVLVLRHRVGGRWLSASTHSVRLSRKGRYSSVLRLARGRWRVSADYGAARSRSIVFRVL
jgi:hypothetical protein